MSNVSKMYFKLNAYDAVTVNPAIKPGSGELAAIMLTDGRIVLNRVIKNMQGAVILGRPVQLRRSYSNGTPPYSMADARDERAFYNSLQGLERILYKGLLKAERRRTFTEYQRITDYFFERLNNARRRQEQEGVQ